METMSDHDITPEEAAQLAAEADGASGFDLAAPLRALGPTGELDLDFTDRVMARVHGQGFWQRLSVRMRRPVSPRSSVLASLPIVAAVIVVTLFVFRQSSLLASKPSTGSLHVAGDLYPVSFELAAPDATLVTLAGDFNSWRTDTIPLADPDRDGVWTVTVPLAPGRYTYTFVVDGKERVIDPGAEVDRSPSGPRSILRL